MDGRQDELKIGVKTFFVVPEISLLPEEYLKSFFIKGYESYFLDDDPYTDLQTKIHLLFSLFPEVILFFNVDRPIRGINWPVFIRNLQNTYKERAIIGVLYRKRNNLEDVKQLERLFLFDIGIVGGCIPIEYQKGKNLFLIQNVLQANQANGQRKYIRAICDEFCKVNMKFEGKKYYGLLRDISISHFSCVFVGDLPQFQLHQKINDIQISLKGTICKMDGVYCLQRVMGDDNIHVFVFRTVEDREGLNSENLSRVNNFIFNMFTSNVQNLLKDECESDSLERIKSESRELLV